MLLYDQPANQPINVIDSFVYHIWLVLSVGAVEYTDCISAKE